MKELGDFIGGMFKDFPKFTMVFIFIIFYMLWLSSGGVERGEARRALGEDSLFVGVKGVPDSYGEDELFGAVPAETVEEELNSR